MRFNPENYMKEKVISGLLYMVSLLPFRVLYIISDFLYFLLYHVVGYRKKVVLENLRNSFPEKTESERQEIARKFFRYLPDIMVEAVKAKSISKREVMRRFEFIDSEEVYRHFEAGKGVIGVTAHYGNWELGIHRLSLMTAFPRLVVYKPMSDKSFEQVYNGVRSRFGATMVPMKQILRHVVKLRNAPHISVFVADQTPGYQDSDYYMPFLNQDTLVFTGPERIARMTKLPLVFCEIRRKEKRGFYSCKFTTLVENPDDYSEHEITKIHNEFTERIIREEPQYWLWSHRRWKRKRREV